MEFIREDCIYARQSVDRKDSISIESQIDFCKYELKGGSCRVFKDKGYSGKNTDRPEFQKLLGEIRKGKVRRVIVYKLDRISRSILDFATMMELFQEYDVEFVSSTEKFDTSTPMGRAMLNICIVFAQLERETIQKRVTDAYYSRCLKGFHMSGQLDMMVMMSLWLTVRIALYENYTSTEEFLPQFDANVEDVIKLLDDIPKLKEMVNNGRKP